MNALIAVSVILGGIIVLLYLIAHIWITIIAFKQSVGWGLACLFVPFVGIIFAIVHWPVAKKQLVLMSISVLLGMLLLILSFSLVGSYNTLVSLDETVKSAWSQVQNQYQRRADLIPNLVKTVEGAATFEKETLKGVIEARAKATQPQVNADNLLNDPQAFQKYQQAQDNLGAALGRLMVVVERYPELKANQNFLDLQTQLEGTENRITVERRRFNETVQGYNTKLRTFPTVMIAGMFGFQQRPYFEAAADAQEVPKVDFSGLKNQQ